MSDVSILRSAFSYSLVQLLWSEEAEPFFIKMGDCHWTNGGCHTLARALLQYFEQQDYAVSLAAIANEDEDTLDPFSVHHVVVELYLDKEKWYIDADGVWTAHEIAEEWQERRQRRMVIENCLTTLDDLAWLESEVPSHPHLVKSLMDLLVQKLGKCPL